MFTTIQYKTNQKSFPNHILNNNKIYCSIIILFFTYY